MSREVDELLRPPETWRTRCVVCNGPADLWFVAADADGGVCEAHALQLGHQHMIGGLYFGPVPDWFTDSFKFDPLERYEPAYRALRHLAERDRAESVRLD